MLNIICFFVLSIFSYPNGEDDIQEKISYTHLKNKKNNLKQAETPDPTVTETPEPTPLPTPEPTPIQDYSNQIYQGLQKAIHINESYIPNEMHNSIFIDYQLTEGEGEYLIIIKKGFTFDNVKFIFNESVTTRYGAIKIDSVEEVSIIDCEFIRCAVGKGGNAIYFASSSSRSINTKVDENSIKRTIDNCLFYSCGNESSSEFTVLSDDEYGVEYINSKFDTNTGGIKIGLNISSAYIERCIFSDCYRQNGNELAVVVISNNKCTFINNVVNFTSNENQTSISGLWIQSHGDIVVTNNHFYRIRNTLTKNFGGGGILISELNNDNAKEEDTVIFNYNHIEDCGNVIIGTFNIVKVYNFNFDNNIIENCIIKDFSCQINLENSKYYFSEYVLTNLTLKGCESNSRTGGGLGIWLLFSKKDYDFGNNIIKKIRQGKFTLKDCTFINNLAGSDGKQNNYPVGGSGGAVHFGNATTSKTEIIIDGCTFEGNRAKYFGGAISLSTTPKNEIRNCVFINNSALDGGGAVCIIGQNYYDYTFGIEENYGIMTQCTISNCTFKFNYDESNKNIGHAIYTDFSDKDAETNFDIIDCNFIDNIKSDQVDGITGGYSILADAPQFTFNNSKIEFTNNIKSTSGLKIHSNTNTLSIHECEFINNSGTFSGALEISSIEGDASISKSTFSNNKAKVNGGGVFCSLEAFNNGQISFEGCHFNDNAVEEGKGGALYIYTENDAIIKDCYFNNNQATNMQECKGGDIFISEIGTQLTMTGCQFNGNFANEGQAIYGSVNLNHFIINTTNFNSNVNQDVNENVIEPQYMIVLETESLDISEVNFEMENSTNSEASNQISYPILFKASLIISKITFKSVNSSYSPIIYLSEVHSITFDDISFINCNPKDFVIQSNGEFNFYNSKILNDQHCDKKSIFVSKGIADIQNSIYNQTGSAIEISQDADEITINGCNFMDCYSSGECAVIQISNKLATMTNNIINFTSNSVGLSISGLFISNHGNIQVTNNKFIKIRNTFDFVIGGGVFITDQKNDDSKSLVIFNYNLIENVANMRYSIFTIIKRYEFNLDHNFVKDCYISDYSSQIDVSQNDIFGIEYTLTNHTLINCESVCLNGGFGFWLLFKKNEIDIRTGKFNLRDSLFKYNKCAITEEGSRNVGYGGALNPGFSSICNTEINIINTTFIGNEARKAGGAISLQMSQPATIFNCTFTDNIAREGGGAIHIKSYMYNDRYHHMPYCTISQCIFKSNKDTQNVGHAIFFDYMVDCNTTLIINDNCSFIDNGINIDNNNNSKGYAIFAKGPEINLENSTIEYSTQDSSHSGIEIKNECIFDNCTSENIPVFLLLANNLLVYDGNTIKNCKYNQNIGKIKLYSNDPTLHQTISRFQFINNYQIEDDKSNEISGLSIEDGLYGRTIEITYELCLFEFNKVAVGCGGSFCICSKILNDIKFNNCTFCNNTSPIDGGALYISMQKTVHLYGCEFYDNKCGKNGSALYIGCYETSVSDAHSQIIAIENCIFENNSGGTGGGIYIYPGNHVEQDKIVVTNCVFLSNIALNGNAIFVDKGNSESLEIAHCVFNDTDKSFDDSLFVFDNSSNLCSSLDISTVGILVIESCSFIKATNKVEKDTKFASLYHHSTNPINTIKIQFCLFDGLTCSNYKTFSIQSANDLTFSHNTFENIGTRENPTEDSIGEILISDKSITIDHCKFNHVFGSSTSVFKGNEIRVTKAGSLEAISLVYSSCEWTDNQAVFTKLSRIQNHSQNGIDSSFLSVTLTYINSTFTRNKSDKEGGAAFVCPNSCSPTKFDVFFEDCVFSENEASENGGAISIEAVTKVTILNCTFEKNMANSPSNSLSKGKGGSICISTIFNKELFECNSYPNETMSLIQIEKCIFNSNQAQNGHAIYLRGDDYGTAISILNNSFTNNKKNEGDESVTSIILSDICNISSDKLFVENNFENSTSSILILQTICDNFAETETLPSLEISSNNDFSNSVEITEDQDSIVASPTENQHSSDISLLSASNLFTGSQPFSATSLFSSTAKFSESLSFTSSDDFTLSSPFTISNTLKKVEIDYAEYPPTVDKKVTIVISFSKSYSLTYVKRKSVSFSFSNFVSNTFELVFDESHFTYTMIATQHNYNAYFPYIIYYLSPLYVEKNITLALSLCSEFHQSN